MPFNWTTRTYTPVGDAVTAAPGQLITSANWNTIHADFSSALTTLAKSVTLNILDFGGDSTGTSDNTTAFNNAVAALATTGGAIYFPAGVYLFNSSISVTFPAANALYSFKIIGDGLDASILKFHGGAGLTCTYNLVSANGNQSAHFADITFATDGTNQGVGVLLTNAGSGNSGFNTAVSHFTRVAFRGADGYAQTDYWNYCVEIFSVSNIVFDGCIFQGPSTGGGGGVSFAGLAPATGAQQVSFVACAFELLSIGFNLGTNASAVSFSAGCTFGQCGTGIAASSGLTIGATLQVQGCQFYQFAGNGNAIALQTAINGLLISGCMFLCNAANNGGVVLANASNFSITGNEFQAPAGTASVTGVSVAANNAGVCGTITGNVFTGFSGSGSTAVIVQSGVNNILVAHNQYVASGSAPVNDAGTGATTDYVYNNASANYAFGVRNNHGSAGDHGMVVAAGAVGASDSTTVMVALYNSSVTTAVGAISRSGTGVVYGTTSDASLKRNIRPTARGLDFLRRIPVSDYGWAGDDEQRTVQGFVAQHVQPHYPEAVHVSQHNGESMMMLDYGRLTPLAFKAIQELADRLEALEARTGKPQ